MTEISGPLGKISSYVKIPQEIVSSGGKCPAVIMMHGFSSNKETPPFPEIAQALIDECVAVIGFDFEAHGGSDGDFINMTISNEIADAKVVLEFVRDLPFVNDIAFLGHSQGGLVAGMLAGELEDLSLRPRCLILMSPSVSIKDDVLKGRFMNAWFNPANPPDYINVLQHKVGKEYITDAQKMAVFETMTRYSGEVCIIHGKNDLLVPLTCSKKLQQGYPHCTLDILPNTGHSFNSDRNLLIQSITGFIHKNLI